MKCSDDPHIRMREDIQKCNSYHRPNMATEKAVVSQFDLEKIKEKIKHEIKMCSIEFSSPTKKVEKKPRKCSVYGALSGSRSRNSDCPTEKESYSLEVSDHPYTNKHRERPIASKEGRQIKAGEKIRFVRKYQKLTQHRGSKFSESSSDDDSSSSSKNAVIVLVRRGKQKETHLPIGKSDVLLSMDDSFPQSRSCSKQNDASFSKTYIQDVGSLLEKRPGGYMGPCKDSRSKVVPFSEICLKESSKSTSTEEESSGGWETDHDDDSSMNLASHHDDCWLPKEDSRISLLTDSTACLSSESPHFSETFEGCYKVISFSPLALGPSTFMATSTKAADKGAADITGGACIGNGDCIGNAYNEDDGDTPKSCKIEPDDESLQSVNSAPATTECDLDQLLPYLQQNLSLVSVNRQKKRPKGAKGLRFASVQLN
jgi:hypothetical protein